MCAKCLNLLFMYLVLEFFFNAAGIFCLVWATSMYSLSNVI